VGGRGAFGRQRTDEPPHASLQARSLLLVPRVPDQREREARAGGSERREALRGRRLSRDRHAEGPLRPR